MVHVSMSDSVNAVQERYTRFTADIAPDRGASAEAAAAAAAREILMRQYPGQKARIDAAFAATLGDRTRWPGASGRDRPRREKSRRGLRRPPERRDQRPRHLPSPDAARRLGADDAAAVLPIRDREALGHEGGEPVPSGRAAEALERALRARLQRDKEFGALRA